MEASANSVKHSPRVLLEQELLKSQIYRHVVILTLDLNENLEIKMTEMPMSNLVFMEKLFTMFVSQKFFTETRPSL